MNWAPTDQMSRSGLVPVVRIGQVDVRLGSQRQVIVALRNADFEPRTADGRGLCTTRPHPCTRSAPTAPPLGRATWREEEPIPPRLSSSRTTSWPASLSQSSIEWQSSRYRAETTDPARASPRTVHAAPIRFQICLGPPRRTKQDRSAARAFGAHLSCRLPVHQAGQVSVLLELIR